MGFCFAYLPRALALPGESLSTVARKVSWAEILMLVLVVGACNLTVGFLNGQTITVMVGVIAIPVFLGLLLHVIITKRLAVWSAVLGLTTMTALVMLFDLAVMVKNGYRAWPLFMLAFDAVHIAQPPRRVQMGLLAAVSLWFVITSSEFVFRWGLTDLPYTLPYEERQTVCDKPPCAIPLHGLVYHLFPIALFIVDYKATAGFVQAAATEREKMRQAVSVAQKVSRCLARFDLDLAEHVLAEVPASGDMDDDLVDALSKLLGNLRRYRPYLPHSVIAEERESGASPIASCILPLSERRDSNPTSGSSDVQALSVFSSPSSAPAASPTGAFAPTLMKHQAHLVKQNATVALFTSDLAKGMDKPDLDVYVADHRAFVTVAMQCINMTRGILMHFRGDHVYASYNAYRRAPSHAACAIDGAIRFLDTFSQSQPTTIIAVATGPVLVGNLGTEHAVSPHTLGHVVGTLDQLAAVGCELGERCVCSPGTFANVSLQYPLRMLMHKFWLVSAGTGAGVLSHTEQEVPSLARALYSLQRMEEVDEAPAVVSPTLTPKHSDHTHLMPPALLGERKPWSQSDSVDMEWLYAMANEPGKRWEIFNDAGKMWHRDGEAAALAWLEKKAHANEGGSDGEIAALFRAALREAREYDFRLAVRGWRGCRDKSNDGRYCASVSTEADDLDLPVIHS